MFKMNLIISPFIWLSFIIGLHWGIMGVAVCYAIVNCCWSLIAHSVANRLIDLSLSEFLSVFRKPVIYTFIMVATVTIARLFMSYLLKDNSVIILFSLFSCGILTYLIILLKSTDDDVLSMRRFISEKGAGYMKPVFNLGRQ